MGSNPSQTAYNNNKSSIPVAKKGGFFNADNDSGGLDDDFDRDPVQKKEAQPKRKPFFAQEDDLDDLDDLMDNMNVGGSKPTRPKKEEDDFFVGAGTRDKKKVKKETKADADDGRDTLSFLRRAEEEQEAKTQKLRMEAEEAKESYKELNELKVDLSGFNLQQPD